MHAELAGHVCSGGWALAFICCTHAACPLLPNSFFVPLAAHLLPPPATFSLLVILAAADLWGLLLHAPVCNQNESATSSNGKC